MPFKDDKKRRDYIREYMRKRRRGDDAPSQRANDADDQSARQIREAWERAREAREEMDEALGEFPQLLDALIERHVALIKKYNELVDDYNELLDELDDESDGE